MFFSCFQFGQTMTNLANAKYRYLIQQLGMQISVFLHLVRNDARNTHFILHQKERKKPLLAAGVSEDNAQG